MKNTPQPRWHLLGAGSLGCLFAAYMQRAGIAVEFIVRDCDTAQMLQADGGITLTRGDSQTKIDISACAPADVSKPIERLLVCTKAHQTLEAITPIKSKLAANAAIVLMQNGMGVRELLERELLEFELPDITILHGLSTEGAFRTARFHVTHAGHGETVIGAINPAQQKIAEHIVQSLQCERPIILAVDIERRLWLKLAVNSVINPLTALHRCRNGELLKREDIDNIVTQLCDELASIASAEHIDLTASQMRDEIYRVMHLTAHNKSSMLQDVEAMRRTEIDFINGFIVERAQTHRLPCPQHKHLLHAIRALHP